MGQASELNQPELKEPLAHSGETLGYHRTLVENGFFIIFSFTPPPSEGEGEAEELDQHRVIRLSQKRRGLKHDAI